MGGSGQALGVDGALGGPPRVLHEEVLEARGRADDQQLAHTHADILERVWHAAGAEGEPARRLAERVRADAEAEGAVEDVPDLMVPGMHVQTGAHALTDA
jgi:hypothetical protein